MDDIYFAESDLEILNKCQYSRLSTDFIIIDLPQTVYLVDKSILEQL